MVILFVQDEPASVPATPLSAIVLPVGTGDIRLDAWVDDSRIAPRQTIHYRIAIHNVTDDQINDIALKAFQARGVVVIGANREQWIPQKGLLCDSLPPQQVFTIDATLRAADRPGKYGIGSVIEWKSHGVEHWKAVTLAPITIENEERHAYFQALKTLVGFLKDFALPVALAWLAYRLKKIEDERAAETKRIESDRAEALRKTESDRAEALRRIENDRADELRRIENDRTAQLKEAEDKRAAKRRAAEERRAQVQQTWTLMLPKMHQNAERYYMRLMADAANVAGYYRKDPDTCFFFYLRFFARMKRMIDDISGFYLRHRAGEETASIIWDRLRNRLDERVTRVVRERAQILMMVPKMTSADFRKNFASAPEITALHPTFFHPAAYEEFVVDVKLFELFALVLVFEVNYSYEFWYVPPEEFPEEEWHSLYADLYGAGLLGFLPEEEFAELLTALDAYAKNVAERVQKMQTAEGDET